MKKSTFFVWMAIFCMASHAAPPGYTELPNAEMREQAFSGYKLFPGLATSSIEVVEENTGKPNPDWAPLITDPKFAKQIEAGDFKSLQVRQLGIKVDEIYSDKTSAHFPFIVSVKHSQGSNTSPMNPNKGTIEVKGEIVVQSDGKDGKDLTVTVVQFDDSQQPERIVHLIGDLQHPLHAGSISRSQRPEP